MAARPKRMFGFDWAAGYVAPFRRAREEWVEYALVSLTLSNSDVVFDLGIFLT